MQKKLKSYIVVDVVINHVEAEKKKKAKFSDLNELLRTRKVVRDNGSRESLFWGKLDIDKIQFLLNNQKNIITNGINGRPDLSFITSQDTFLNPEQLQDFRESLSDDKQEILTNCYRNIPGLVAIAEMYYDYLKSTKPEGMSFGIVSSVLNSIVDKPQE